MLRHTPPQRTSSPHHYRTIVADPPWPQKTRGTLQGREGWHDSHGASQPMRYQTMSVADIAAMPVRELADPAGCHLYLWATNRYLADAFDVARAWGFRFSTVLTWAKNPMGGGLGGAYGISTEFIVYARRGRLAERERVAGTWWNWKRPYDVRGKAQHSAKPSEFYAMAERVNHAPRLELFARRERPGWDAWGNEAPGAVTLPALEAAS
jgi:N6-adenosine-specific RNA methylase IME4